MREMKDSGIEWIGEIPKSWTITILSALFSERKCKNSGLTENNLLSLSYGNIVRKNIESNEGLLPASFETYNIIEPGNIVFRLTDLQNDKRSLRTGLCKERGIITSAYVTLQVRSDDSPRYMHYLFHTYDLCKVFYGMGDGVRQGMNYEDLKRLRILRPDQETQRRIADYLDRKCSQIDAIIARQQEVIEKLKAYKLSVITETVTKGLNPDVPMKDSGVEWIGEIPEHWTMLKLKHASSILRGKFNHRPRNDPAYYDGNHPFVQTGDVARANKYIKNYSQTLNEKGYAVSKEFPANSICMTIAANVGDVAILTFDACFPDSVVGFVPSDNIAWNYLYYVLTAMKKQFVRNAIISTQLNLNIEIIKEEFIPVAPLHIQEQISKFLDDKSLAIDRTISAKQCVIDKLTDYKKSLIYEVVTGKKEV